MANLGKVGDMGSVFNKVHDYIRYSSGTSNSRFFWRDSNRTAMNEFFREDASK